MMRDDGFDPDFAAPSDWARLYRAHAIQIVPAFMPGETKGSWKRPLLKSWTEYQNALVPDEVFLPWYGNGGQYIARLNMGVITGKASGNLFVIDLDTYKHIAADQWWQGLLAIHNNGMELETVEQRTGGGGLQKLFYAPSDWVPPTCKTPIGIDIRGQGGFAMLCPSLHDSGRAYEWLEGRAPSEIDIAMAPDWLLKAVETLVRVHGGEAFAPRGERPAGPQPAFDGFGHQTDGREAFMRDLVWGAVVDWYRECPIKPAQAQQLTKEGEKYAVYEKEVAPQSYDPTLTKTQLLERENRGPSLFHVKWQAAMRHWDGKVAEEAGKPQAKKGDGPNPGDYTDFTDEFAKAKTTGNVLEYLNVRQIKSQPDPVWMLDDIIGERALGFIFGPPSSLKTFLALDIALSTTSRLSTWWNRKINTYGAVIYLCREGVASLKFRILAWEQHRKTVADDAPFYLVQKNLNFMNGTDVGLLMATVEAIVAVAGVPIAAIFVDTVSRVLPGAKENQQEDMSLFIGACEALQQRFGCVVIGVHHTNKNGTIRGSTVIPGAGDFLIETRREPGSMKGSIVLQKVKDGEDGQELPFKVTKIELGGIIPRSSLMVDPDDDPGRVKVKGDDLPDMTVCREILSALAMAWFNKMPWGSADNSTRPAVRLIMARWSLKRDAVKRLLDGWMANGIIEYAVYDVRKKLSGYRKIIDL